jgi:predicted alpha/beta-hydrolase family hydrolase
MASEQFANPSVDPPVRGFLHKPISATGVGLVVTHGAGGNCNSPMLIVLSERLCDMGLTVLRCNLPFRQNRSYGPPRPAEAARDREGLRNAIQELRNLAVKQVMVGGQSYGGRQASMLCAEDPRIANGLFLLSYPLHPPGKPDQLRTQHLSQLKIPTLIVHGTRDPFASVEEIENAAKLIPAETRILHAEAAGHDLGFAGKKRNEKLIPEVIEGMNWLIGNLRADS